MYTTRMRKQSHGFKLVIQLRLWVIWVCGEVLQKNEAHVLKFKHLLK